MSAPAPQTTLGDACADLLLLAVEIQKPGVELPDGQTFRARVKGQLQALEAQLERRGVGRPDIADTSYALVALIDELLHFSGWATRLGWEHLPLQAELFGDRNAGVGFFDRLEAVRKRSRDVLEVYFLCLVLGFRGRYRVARPEEMTKLLDALSLELGHDRRALSPRALRSGPAPLPPSAFPWLPAGGAVLGVAVLLSLVLFFLLAGARDEAVAAIGVFGR